MNKATGWERLCHEAEEVAKLQDSRIKELESQIAGEWITLKSESDEPDDSLLNELGRRRFLCQVEHRGEMIRVSSHEVVMFTKEAGFLVKNKGPLIGGVIKWMPLPKGPSQ